MMQLRKGQEIIDQSKKIAAFIFGAGSQGRVVLDLLRTTDRYSSIQFLDDNAALKGTTINGAVVAGGEILESYAPHTVGVIVAMGHPFLREQIFASIDALGVEIINAIHPTAVIVDTATVGRGNMICAGAVINTSARIGNSTIINPTAVVEHDTKIGDFVTLAAGAVVGARVDIGKASFVGIAAAVLPDIKIGSGSIIGISATVLKDIPDNVFALGMPARPIERAGPEFDYRRVL